MKKIQIQFLIVLMACLFSLGCSKNKTCQSSFGAYIKGHVHLKFCGENVEMHVTDGNSTTSVFALDAGMSNNKIRIHVEVVTNGAPEMREYKIPQEGMATLSVESDLGTEIYSENPSGKVKIVKLTSTKMYGFFYFEANCFQNPQKKIKSKGWFKFPE